MAAWPRWIKTSCRSVRDQLAFLSAILSVSSRTFQRQLSPVIAIGHLKPLIPLDNSCFQGIWVWRPVDGSGYARQAWYKSFCNWR